MTEVYTFIKDWHTKQKKREERRSGIAIVTPCIAGISGKDFIVSVHMDSQRVSLVKLYAWIKEEMSKSSAKSITDYLYSKGRLSRVDCEAICHCSWRRGAVEQLLKKILMKPDLFDIFFQSLQEQGERHIAEKLANTHSTTDEVHVFEVLEKSSLLQCPRPDHNDPRFSPTESKCQMLLYNLNNKHTIDAINDSLLSRFYFSIREHTNICACSMDSEGRVRELLKIMKLCSHKIFYSLSDILDAMEMEHVTRKLREDNPTEDQPCTPCIDSCIEDGLVTSIQESSSSLLLNAANKLELDVENVNKGSIVIQLCPKSQDTWRRLEESCTSGKIKDFIPAVYNNDAIQDLLQEGVYRLQFTIYTIQTLPTSETTDQEGGKKILFHLQTEHDALQQDRLYTNMNPRVPVYDVGHHGNPIEDYMDLLCEELEISTALLKLLKEQNTVQDNINEGIDKQGSRAKKIKYLLKQVSRHGNLGYEVLKKHIKEVDEDLYKELMTRQANDSKQLFFSGTVVLKVEKNVEPSKKEGIDPDTEKRKLEISCPEMFDSVCYFTYKSAADTTPMSGGEEVTILVEDAWKPAETSMPSMTSSTSKSWPSSDIAKVSDCGVDCEVGADMFTSLGEVSAAMRRAGVNKCGLIFGIDYTMSNQFQGEKSFGGRCLHDISGPSLNPYQKVMCILGETLEWFDDDGVIPAFGFGLNFGDAVVWDGSVFPLKGEKGECNGFAEVLEAYKELMPKITLGGPTDFAPLIRKAIDIVMETKQYHILVICADGMVTNEEETVQAIVEASNYPLSITMIGVGDGPWDTMHEYDDQFPGRKFNNFRFTDFHSVMKNSKNPQPALALSALMDIPKQYNAINSLNLWERID